MSYFFEKAKSFLHGLQPDPELEAFAQKCSLSAFLAASTEEREHLCSELTHLLTTKTKDALQEGDSTRRRDALVEKWIPQLKRWGHDLWRWDCDDDRQVWVCGSDCVGIVVDFQFPDEVEVYWRDAEPTAR